jgi:tRNA(Ile)-lysidine synthase TilS/MesJ
MLQHLNWRGLENRCKNAQLGMMYKIANEKGATFVLLKIIDLATTRTHELLIFYNLSLQTLQRQESFFPFISDWNQLPPPIVMS